MRKESIYRLRNGEECRVFFSQMTKKQKDYCVSLGIKKFRVEITAIIAYNLEML